MPEPINKALYSRVKAAADKKFLAPTSIYKSAWIVAEYKRRGGKYQAAAKKDQGLARWFKERWVDVTRPIKDKKGKIIDYEDCGRKKASASGVYPVCRPVNHITTQTPKTISELSKRSISKAKREKQTVKHRGHIKFDKK